MLADVFTAVVGLIGAIVGGVLVVIGDALARRAERHGHRIDQLRIAAADVIASYLRVRSHLIARRRDGREVDRSELFPQDRQLALARLFTLPGGETLRGNVLTLANATEEFIAAGDNESFERCAATQLQEIRRLEATVRQMVAKK